jgi:GAF domain-containing protein
MPARDAASSTASVLRLARHVTARHDLDDVLAEVFRCLRPIVAFGGGSIQLLDDEGWIQMASSDPVAPAHVMAQRVPLGSSVGGRVILTESPIYLADIEAGESGTPGRRVSDGVRSYLGVPLVADGRAIGLLQVDSPEPDAWTDDERAIFLGVAPIVAAAIQNARAYARAGSARLRAETVEARLVEARRLAAAARAADRNGDRLEVGRCLAKLETLLAVVPDKHPLLMPQQRVSEPVTPARH